jgi:drug/metabolite transporter (DMT)-like permease
MNQVSQMAAYKQKQAGKAAPAIWTRMPIVVLAALFCCLLWGSASPAIKIGYKVFTVTDTPGRILFSGIRFTIAGLMVILFGSVQSKRLLIPGKNAWGKVFHLSIYQTTIHYILFYMGLAFTSGVRASIINSAGTFFSIFLAVTIFRFEKMSARKALGSLIGFIGVVICVTGGSVSSLLEGSFRLQGEGAVLASAFCGAMASNLIKKTSSTENPVTMSGWQFLVGGLTLTITGLIMGGHLEMTTGAGIILIVYMGFISAGAYTVWSLLLKYNPVSTVTILGFMNPVFGVLLSVIFLNEKSEAMSWTGIAALMLVSLGIVITNRTSQRKHVNRQEAQTLTRSA